MRNGMSVKEIYEALDRLERITESYEDLRTSLDNVVTNVSWVKDRIKRTMMQYQNLVMSPVASRADKLEFKGKISGLEEALHILDDTLRPVRLGNVLEEDEDGT